MNEVAVPMHTFQYASAEHQSQTALAGMWLFLATELLFFGALVLGWIYCRHADMAAFDLGGRQTSLTLGTINTVLLVSSSFFYTIGSSRMEASGDRRSLIRYSLLTWLLGAAFLVSKFAVEWREDFEHHLFPGADFAIQGAAPGGAQLFFSFYFLGTALHGLHMLVGLALLAWIIKRTRAGEFGAGRCTPVTAVGLYWSFVDMVWLMLFPLIYLIGRGP